MCAAFRLAKVCNQYMGFHTCGCGASSTAFDYELPNGDQTISLCMHYVAHHRSEVPSEELLRVEGVACGESEPTAEELQGPAFILDMGQRLISRVLVDLPRFRGQVS